MRGAFSITDTVCGCFCYHPHKTVQKQSQSVCHTFFSEVTLGFLCYKFQPSMIWTNIFWRTSTSSLLLKESFYFMNKKNWLAMWNYKQQRLGKEWSGLLISMLLISKLRLFHLTILITDEMGRWVYNAVGSALAASLEPLGQHRNVIL